MNPAHGLLASIALGISCGPAAAIPFQIPSVWLDTPVFGSAALADVNGDGLSDLVIVGAAIHVALSSGSHFEPAVQWHQDLCANAVCKFADVNGDGRADAIAFDWGTDASDARVMVALSTGSGFGSEAEWHAAFCLQDQTCKVGDVDGDGRSDILAFTQNFGLVWVSLSNGSAFEPSSLWNNFFCIAQEFCEVGDVDADGRADAVLFKPRAPGVQKGNVLIAPSAGSAFSTPKLGHGYFCIDAENCYVADFNGDGRVDIGLRKDRPLAGFEFLVSLSDGDRFLNPIPFTWLVSDGKEFVIVGDVDGDLQSDLVLIAPSEGQMTRYSAALAASGGKPGANPEGVPGVQHVEFYNCFVERRPVYLWLHDTAAGTRQSFGPVDSSSDAFGTCDTSGEGFDFNFETGRDYIILAVDPGGLACDGTNNPDLLGCRRQPFRFPGDANGADIDIVMPAATGNPYLY